MTSVKVRKYQARVIKISRTGFKNEVLVVDRLGHIDKLMPIKEFEKFLGEEKTKYFYFDNKNGKIVLLEEALGQKW